MRKIILLLVLALGAWKIYESIQRKPAPAPSASSAQELSMPPAELPAKASYTCDGRKYCSEMHSCEEAEYFLQHCPGVKMDGDNDGVPCEKQWCS